MKLKRLFAALALATVGALASAAAITSNPKEVKEVKAEDWIQNPTVYFAPHDNWVQNGNETFKMNYYDNSTYKGSVQMSLYGTSNVPGPYYNRKVFKGVVTDGTHVSRVQFCRMDSNYSEQYNYSGQIYLTDGNASPMLMTDKSLSSWNDFTTDTSGVWFTSVVQHAVYKTTDQSPSSNTGRVFFYNSDTHWSSAAGCAVYAWGGSASPTIWTGHSETADATIYNLNWFTDDNGSSYGYADIPLDVSNYKFVTITDVDEYVTATGYFSTNQFNVDSFAYVRYGQANNSEIASGGAKNDVAGANLMKKVVEAYDTCSNSVLNGYGAYSALNTNFYSHATNAAKAATVTSLNGHNMTIQEHFEGMAIGKRGNSNVATLPGETSASNTATAVIVISSIISSVSVGMYFFFKKKKKI